MKKYVSKGELKKAVKNLKSWDQKQDKALMEKESKQKSKRK